MDLIKQAVKDRYVSINKRKNTVTYLPQGKERTLNNPEESVQLETYLDLIYRFDYPAEKVRVCEKVKMGSATREADIVVYNDKARKDPLIIVECKKPRISRKAFQEAIEQGFSYAASTRANYVWATSGDKQAAFEVLPDAFKERKTNKIHRIPSHGELKRSVRKSWRWILSHPVVSDTIVYALVLILSTVLFSKMAVEFNGDIRNITAPLWEENFGMDYNWVFNVIVLLSTLFSMVFGAVFMRSHKFFHTSQRKKRVTRTLIALILFAPAWYIGASNSDPTWWTIEHFDLVKHPIILFLWPYLKAFPIQIGAIYGLIWLMVRNGEA